MPQNRRSEIRQAAQLYHILQRPVNLFDAQYYPLSRQIDAVGQSMIADPLDGG